MMSTDARRMALNVLNRLDKEHKTLDTIMEEVSDAGLTDDRRERALLQAMVYGVLRWRGRLDWIIAEFSKSPLTKIDPEILNILRLGLFQIIYLSKIPVSAAVNTSVEMAKSIAAPWVAKYVNAVLRNAIRKYETLTFPNPDKNPIEALSTNSSFPQWLISRWLKRFGLDETQQLCDAINTVPPLTIRANTLRANRQQLMERLQSEVEHPQYTPYAPDGITFSHPRASIPDLPAFQHGWFQVQDEAAQLVSLMVNPRPGDTVLDACAGLGGKTGHMAQLMENRGRIVAMDHDAIKLRKLETEMHRLGVSNVETLCHDLSTPMAQDYHSMFDRILLDAPCSGLGVLRKNPDIKWRLSRKNLQTYQHRQIRFLDILAPCIKPTGVIVYSVCSSEPEENEEVIRLFLKRHPEFFIDTELTYLTPEIHSLIDGNGTLKTQPHTHHMDGFFAVVLKLKP